jgi:hypothetical protein
MLLPFTEVKRILLSKRIKVHLKEQHKAIVGPPTVPIGTVHHAAKMHPLPLRIHLNLHPAPQPVMPGRLLQP